MLQQLISDYPHAFTENIALGQYVNCPPIRIHVRPDATPVLHTVARPYPVGREKECSAFIQDMASSGVIVRNNKVSSWCAIALFMAKPGGGLRQGSF